MIRTSCFIFTGGILDKNESCLIFTGGILLIRTSCLIFTGGMEALSEFSRQLVQSISSIQLECTKRRDNMLAELDAVSAEQSTLWNELRQEYSSKASSDTERRTENNVYVDKELVDVQDQSDSLGAGDSYLASAAINQKSVNSKLKLNKSTVHSMNKAASSNSLAVASNLPVTIGKADVRETTNSASKLYSSNNHTKLVNVTSERTTSASQKLKVPINSRSSESSQSTGLLNNKRPPIKK